MARNFGMVIWLGSLGIRAFERWAPEGKGPPPARLSRGPTHGALLRSSWALATPAESRAATGASVKSWGLFPLGHKLGYSTLRAPARSDQAYRFRDAPA